MFLGQTSGLYDQVLASSGEQIFNLNVLKWRTRWWWVLKLAWLESSCWTLSMGYWHLDQLTQAHKWAPRPACHSIEIKQLAGRLGALFTYQWFCTLVVQDKKELPDTKIKIMTSIRFPGKDNWWCWNLIPVYILEMNRSDKWNVAARGPCGLFSSLCSRVLEKAFAVPPFLSSITDFCHDWLPLSRLAFRNLYSFKRYNWQRITHIYS